VDHGRQTRHAREAWQAPDVHGEMPEGEAQRESEQRLVFDVRDSHDRKLRDIVLSLTPFRKVVKDYFLVCESYYAAIKKLGPSQIEALDMGRRGLHNEGSELLRERLAGKIEVDLDTARRLFTLICALHITS
jgi:uncharacterized protein (UPF0262 family)